MTYDVERRKGHDLSRYFGKVPVAGMTVEVQPASLWRRVFFTDRLPFLSFDDIHLRVRVSEQPSYPLKLLTLRLPGHSGRRIAIGNEPDGKWHTHVFRNPTMDAGSYDLVVVADELAEGGKATHHDWENVAAIHVWIDYKFYLSLVPTIG
ncbi:MAG: hypothetical protein HY533_05015, partial [Chloroflexi bacterium]|nr:hypothetical protein [Chloroflexota bacterium]